MTGKARANGAAGNGAVSDLVTVPLPERIDSVTATEVEKLMLSALTPGAKVIVDGSAVTYMSAAGVRALATALRKADERDAHMVLCRFSGPAADCLVVGGFSELLDVVASVEEAAATLRRKLVGNAAERLQPHGIAG